MIPLKAWNSIISLRNAACFALSGALVLAACASSGGTPGAGSSTTQRNSPNTTRVVAGYQTASDVTSHLTAEGCGPVKPDAELGNLSDMKAVLPGLVEFGQSICQQYADKRFVLVYLFDSPAHAEAALRIDPCHHGTFRVVRSRNAFVDVLLGASYMHAVETELPEASDLGCGAWPPK